MARFKIGMENGKTKSYHKDNYRKLVIVRLASLDRGGIPITSIESYYYQKVLMHSVEEVVLTRLLKPDFDKVPALFKDIHGERIRKFFCLVNPV